MNPRSRLLTLSSRVFQLESATTTLPDFLHSLSRANEDAQDTLSDSEFLNLTSSEVEVFQDVVDITSRAYSLVKSIQKRV